MAELDEIIRGMGKREKEGKSAGGSGNGSDGTGRDLLSYVDDMKEDVMEPPDTAEEWPWYFRYAELLFECYAVPERYHGKIVKLWLNGRVKGLSRMPGGVFEEYELIKEAVFREYGVMTLQHQRNGNADDQHWVEQRGQEGEINAYITMQAAVEGELNEIALVTPRDLREPKEQRASYLGENEAPGRDRVAMYGGEKPKGEAYPVSAVEGEETIRTVSVGSGESAGENMKPEGLRVDTTPRSHVQEVRKKRALSFGAEEEPLRNDHFGLGGRKTPQPGGEKLSEKTLKGDGPVNAMAVAHIPRVGEGRSGNNLSYSQVGGGFRQPVCNRGKKKQKESTLMVNEGEEYAVPRKADDRNSGDLSVSDQSVLKVRYGNRAEVVFKGRRRNLSLSPLGSGKIRGTKGGRSRASKARHPPVASRGGHTGDKAVVIPRKCQMRIREKLHGMRERVWMGKMTRRWKDAEISWKGIGREFGNLAFWIGRFRDKM